MNAFALSGLLTGLSSTGFGFLVLLKSPNRRIAWRWFLFAISVAVWGFGGMQIGLAKTPEENLFWFRIAYGFGVIWIPIFFYHFVLVFRKAKNMTPVLFQYGIGLCLLFILPTRLLLGGERFMFHSLYFAQAGFIYPYYFAWWTALVGYSHWRLVQDWHSLSFQEQNQIKYFMLATGIGFSGGLTAYLPSFGISIYPWGNFAIVIYPIIMSYAILQHQLMDVQFVIRKTLLYSLVSATLASVYVTTITLLAQVLGRQHGPASAFTSGVAAIFITLLFNPLRIRTQGWIDRQFPRERLDPGLLQEAAGGFAHEMKRPLSKISLPAELALMDLERAKRGEITAEEAYSLVEERLRFIMSQSIDAGYMIEAIRELSASAATELVPLDLGNILDNALKAEKELLDKYGIATRLGLPFEPLIVPGRARQLEIVLINLIKNAAEAMSGMPAGKERELTIKGATSNGDVVLSISDNGLGIKPDDIGKVFQPQYTTKGAYGTGMGLYLSHQIAQSHGGSLTVESAEGQGAVFFLKLPAKNRLG